MKYEHTLSETIIESIPGIFCMFGANLRYTQWNRYLRCQILGKSVTEMEVTDALANVHPDDLPLAKSIIDSVLDMGGHETTELRIFLRGGPDFKWFLFSGRRIMDKEQPYLLVTGADITARKQVEEERKKLLIKLQQALDNVNVLSGLLPICSYCKKIRDDKGYWNKIESYISEHSEAEFSHCICQECSEEKFPGMDLYDAD